METLTNRSKPQTWLRCLMPPSIRNAVCPASGLTGFTQGTCTPGELTTLDPLNNDQFDDPFFKRQTYHNVRLNWDIPETEFSFYVGVDNVFDNKPPFGQLGTAEADPFETFGAFYYVGFNADF